jgi:hypothetical protein
MGNKDSRTNLRIFQHYHQPSFLFPVIISVFATIPTAMEASFQAQIMILPDFVWVGRVPNPDPPSVPLDLWGGMEAG